MRTSLHLSLLVALACACGSAASAQELEVLRATKITEGGGGFTGDLDVQDEFGSSVAGLGDLNSDGVEDLAVGAWWDDDGGGFDPGAVWILFLNTDGTVASHQKISATEGGLVGPLLGFQDNFGEAVSAIGDLDGDGTADLAVGAPGAGAIWILFLNADGTVRAEQKIAEGVGGFTSDLGNAADSFGDGVAPLGDLDGDGVTDLAVGAPLDDDGGDGAPEPEFTNRGAVWILFLNADGTVREHRKISQTEGGFTGLLTEFDNMGKDVAAVGDLDGNGVTDLAVGAWADSDDGQAFGAVWMVLLNADGTVASQQKISASEGGFEGDIGVNSYFGYGVGTAGDLNGDTVPDLAVGAIGSGLGDDTGVVYLLYLRPDGSVTDYAKLSNETPGFEGRLDVGDLFGSDVALLGDLDGEGGPEFAVGAFFDPDAEFGAGAVWVLSLDVEQAPTAVEGGEPSAFSVAVAPNPAVDRVAVAFTLAAPSEVRLSLYDVLGREVAVLVDGERAVGRHEAVLEASRLPSGTYLLRIEAASAMGTLVQGRPVTIHR